MNIAVFKYALKCTCAPQNMDAFALLHPQHPPDEIGLGLDSIVRMLSPLPSGFYALLGLRTLK